MNTLKKATNKGNYFHYNADGHWKRNYPLYLKSLKIKKEDKPSKGMFRMLVVEFNLRFLLLLVGYKILIQVLIYVHLYRI